MGGARTDGLYVALAAIVISWASFVGESPRRRAGVEADVRPEAGVVTSTKASCGNAAVGVRQLTVGAADVALKRRGGRNRSARPSAEPWAGRGSRGLSSRHNGAPSSEIPRRVVVGRPSRRRRRGG